MPAPPQKPRVHHFVQAPVRPLDQDGVVIGLLGTLSFALATIVLWINLDWLVGTNHEWWLKTGIAGTVLGVVGTAYCYWRVIRRRRGTWTLN